METSNATAATAERLVIQVDVPADLVRTNLKRAITEGRRQVERAVRAAWLDAATTRGE